MTFPVFWLPEAEADLMEAVAWYRKIRPELGERFVLAVAKAVEAIGENPGRFPTVYRDRHRAGVRQFPYGIFFEAHADRIVVIACFHNRRDPRRWKSR